MMKDHTYANKVINKKMTTSTRQVQSSLALIFFKLNISLNAIWGKSELGKLNIAKYCESDNRISKRMSELECENNH